MPGAYCDTNALRVGWILPLLSVARLCSIAGEPVQSHGRRKRVKLLDRIGPCSAASCQLMPPSAEISTLAMRPAPDHAMPLISYQPRRSSLCPNDGKVMIDFTPSSKVNWRALPSGCKSEYLEVSSLVCVGPSVTLMRRSHFTFILPSQPGSSRRIG